MEKKSTLPLLAQSRSDKRTRTRGASMNRQRCMTLLSVALVVISGCADSTHSQYRDQQTEELIRSFYPSSREKIEIASVMGGSKIDAYCVLEPYEDRLNDKDNLAVPANDFLNQIELLPQEEYWHIVARSGDRFTLIRIEQRSIPLLTPKSTYMQSSCTVEKSIVIRKGEIPTHKHPTVRIGN